MSPGNCPLTGNRFLNVRRGQRHTTTSSPFAEPHEGPLLVPIPCAVLTVVIITVSIMTIVTLFVGKYNCPDQYMPSAPSNNNVSSAPSNNYVSSCSNDWIGYQRKCYFISTAKGDWTSAQKECVQHGAALAVFHSEKKENMRSSESFLQRYVGAEKHWIRLITQSPEVGHTWNWSNSKEEMWFKLTGSVNCTFLNSTGVYRIECEEKLPWICSKPSI
ncbi:early activation antigen CD69 [Talpa occidentalis]|uniref:early activation antigen CD69 n=1 Tax=Talpa occidentalis TaxID=50954 RepID=UPI00188E5D3A|nr:early activation antigen CD69 [Talpa occidentalis]